MTCHHSQMEPFTPTHLLMEAKPTELMPYTRCALVTCFLRVCPPRPPPQPAHLGHFLEHSKWQSWNLRGQGGFSKLHPAPDSLRHEENITFLEMTPSGDAQRMWRAGMCVSGHAGLSFVRNVHDTLQVMRPHLGTSEIRRNINYTPKVGPSPAGQIGPS